MAELQGKGLVGRAVKAYKGDETTGVLFIAQTKTITLNGEPIDQTSDSDEGFRTLLNDPSVRSMDISIEGKLRQDDFINQYLDPSNSIFLEEYTLVIPKIGTIVGDFFLSNFETGAPHDDGVTFSSSLLSSGEWTFTAETP